MAQKNKGTIVFGFLGLKTIMVYFNCHAVTHILPRSLLVPSSSRVFPLCLWESSSLRGKNKCVWSQKTHLTSVTWTKQGAVLKSGCKYVCIYVLSVLFHIAKDL